MRRLILFLVSTSLMLLPAGCSAPRETPIHVPLETPPNESIAKSVDADPSEIELPKIITIGMGSRGTNYVVCKLALVASQDDHDVIYKNLERLREAAEEQIATKPLRELATLEGRDRLRYELVEIFRDCVPELGELHVRIKQFLIQ